MALTQAELEALAAAAESRRESAELESFLAESTAELVKQTKTQALELKKIIKAKEELAALGVANAQAEADRAKAQLAALQAQIDANEQIDITTTSGTVTPSPTVGGKPVIKVHVLVFIHGVNGEFTFAGKIIEP